MAGMMYREEFKDFCKIYIVLSCAIATGMAIGIPLGGFLWFALVV